MSGRLSTEKPKRTETSKDNRDSQSHTHQTAQITQNSHTHQTAQTTQNSQTYQTSLTSNAHSTLKTSQTSQTSQTTQNSQISQTSLTSPKSHTSHTRRSISHHNHTPPRRLSPKGISWLRLEHVDSAGRIVGSQHLDASPTSVLSPVLSSRSASASASASDLSRSEHSNRASKFESEADLDSPTRLDGSTASQPMKISDLSKHLQPQQLMKGHRIQGAHIDLGSLQQTRQSHKQRFLADGNFVHGEDEYDQMEKSFETDDAQDLAASMTRRANQSQRESAVDEKSSLLDTKFADSVLLHETDHLKLSVFRIRLLEEMQKRKAALENDAAEWMRQMEAEQNARIQQLSRREQDLESKWAHVSDLEQQLIGKLEYIQQQKNEYKMKIESQINALVERRVEELYKEQIESMQNELASLYIVISQKDSKIEQLETSRKVEQVDTSNLQEIYHKAQELEKAATRIDFERQELISMQMELDKQREELESRHHRVRQVEEALHHERRSLEAVHKSLEDRKVAIADAYRSLNLARKSQITMVNRMVQTDSAQTRDESSQASEIVQTSRSIQTDDFSIPELSSKEGVSLEDKPILENIEPFIYYGVSDQSESNMESSDAPTKISSFVSEESMLESQIAIVHIENILSSLQPWTLVAKPRIQHCVELLKLLSERKFSDSLRQEYESLIGKATKLSEHLEHESLSLRDAVSVVSEWKKMKPAFLKKESFQNVLSRCEALIHSQKEWDDSVLTLTRTIQAFLEKVNPTFSGGYAVSKIAAIFSQDDEDDVFEEENHSKPIHSDAVLNAKKDSNSALVPSSELSVEFKKYRQQVNQQSWARIKHVVAQPPRRSPPVPDVGNQKHESFTHSQLRESMMVEPLGVATEAQLDTVNTIHRREFTNEPTLQVEDDNSSTNSWPDEELGFEDMAMVSRQVESQTDMQHRTMMLLGRTA